MLLTAVPAAAELTQIPGRQPVPGLAVHPSGALIYQPFLTGVAVYHAIREYGDRRPVRPAAAVYLALALMAALPFLGSLPVVGGLLKVLPRHILYGLSFGLLTYGLSAVQPVVLVNRVMRAIGKVSFSAYVLHFAVLDVR